MHEADAGTYVVQIEMNRRVNGLLEGTEYHLPRLIARLICRV
jgi:hypothetical protein